MALSFPTNPTSGQTYQSGSSATYQYNGTYWTVALPQSQILATAISASFATSTITSATASFVATASTSLSSSTAVSSSRAITSSFALISSVATSASLATSSSLSEQNKNWILQVYSTANYTLPGAYTADPCRYNIVDIAVNVSSSWFNTSTYVFTPLKAGYWNITAVYDIYRGATAEAGINILKNGTTVATAGTIGVINIPVTKMVYLNGTTDNVQITNQGAATSVRGQGANNSWFQARWLGE